MSYDRLTADNAAVLFFDHQTGLANGIQANGIQTQSAPEFINNVKALVTIAQIYKLPSIITTSAADGPNGPIMPVVAQGLPDAAVVHQCRLRRRSEEDRAEKAAHRRHLDGSVRRLRRAVSEKPGLRALRGAGRVGHLEQAG
jgi:nicotinamidase-related amidase